MRILVTGGAGFIGTHLTEALVPAGHRVRVLDDFSTRRPDNLETVGDDVEVIRGDCSILEVARRAARGMEAVYVRIFASLFGLETLTLRYFNVFGPRQDPSPPYSGVISQSTSAPSFGGAGRSSTETDGRAATSPMWTTW